MLIRGGNVGIGTTEPGAKFDIAAYPYSHSQAGGIRIGDTGHNWDWNLYGRSNSVGIPRFSIGEGSDEYMVFNSSGNVGIGTTAPARKMTIAHINIVDSVGVGDGEGLLFDNTYDAHYTDNTILFRHYRSDGTGQENNARIRSFRWSRTTPGANDRLVFETYNGGTNAWNNNQLVLNSIGNVGIGTTAPSYQLQLSTDSAAKPGTGTWTIDSDERLKDVNGDFTRGLDALSGLYPSYFNYKQDNARGIPSDREYVGLIAQDVRAVIPEAVREGQDGYLSIESDPIFWTMLNAIKELSLKVGSDTISYNREQLIVESGDGEAQVKIAYDEDNFAELQVGATGDLDIGAVGADVRLPDDNLSICSGGACSSEVSQMEGTGNLAVENDLFVDGSLGIGTSTPDRAFNILEAGENPQMKIAYDEDNFAEMQVSAVGDLLLSTRGGDVKLQNENMMVCSGGACPSAVNDLEGVGNLVVENTAFVAGALGIGTAEPQRGLDIFETQTNPQMRISYDEDLYSELSVSATGDLTISAEGGDISVLDENLKVCSGDGCPTSVNALEGAGNLVVENNLLALGNVGVNTAEPSYTLDVNGTLRAYGITDASDIRLKTNIKNLGVGHLSFSTTEISERGRSARRSEATEGVRPLGEISTLSKLQNLRGVTFDWKNKELGEGSQVGMIAQELEKEYPALVNTDDSGFKSIQYGKFTAVLLEGIKELFSISTTIEYRSEKLENRMTELEKENEGLKAKTEKLENRLKALEQILVN